MELLFEELLLTDTTDPLMDDPVVAMVELAVFKELVEDIAELEELEKLETVFFSSFGVFLTSSAYARAKRKKSESMIEIFKCMLYPLFIVN